METLNVELGERSYPIHIGAGLIERAEFWADVVRSGRVVVVSNAAVAPLYLGMVRQVMTRLGVTQADVILPDGEQHKNWQTLNTIFDALLGARCERETPMVALGGGVVGDMTGFAASCYQRGMPFVQVPTTLLSQVDSSVGGKTAINHPLGKNMIGAFYQPRLVLVDTNVLQTLPDRELRSGLAEVIKYGLIRDLPFLEWLEVNLEKLLARDPVALEYAIHRSCANKAEIVVADERETGVRALLNLGHTFGHAIETGMGYGNWLHGEAVAAGTMMAAELSFRMGMISSSAVERIEHLFVRAGLPAKGPTLGAARYLDLMRHDKKVKNGRLRLVLFEAVGQAIVTDLAPDELIVTAIEARCGQA